MGSGMRLAVIGRGSRRAMAFRQGCLLQVRASPPNWWFLRPTLAEARRLPGPCRFFATNRKFSFRPPNGPPAGGLLSADSVPCDGYLHLACEGLPKDGVLPIPCIPRLSSRCARARG